MSHPYNDLRADKVNSSRVSHLTRACGGSAKHPDAKEDKSLVKNMVKSSSLKVEGRKNGGRLDRYARGGAVKKGATNVNVIIAPSSPKEATQTPAIPGMGPAVMGPSPVPPPRPPMAPPPGMPMGGPQAVGAMPPPIRMDGGRVGYKKGGAVKSGAAWEEGLRNGTQVSHSDGKNDGKDIRTTKPITYKKGGKVEAFGMGPKMKGGAEGGLGRLEKARMQKRK